jgi:hypothetical protein
MAWTLDSAGGVSLVRLSWSFGGSKRQVYGYGPRRKIGQDT